MNRETENPDARSMIRRYYVVSYFYSFGPSFIFAVYPLFLHSRGLNQLQVNTVAAVFFCVWLLTDVPTGAFADAVGRRAAAVLGCAFHVGGFALYYFSYRYWHFIAAEILDAIGLTLANGPIDAWLVDGLDAVGFTGAKEYIFSRQLQMMRLAGMGGALAGAYIARANLALPFLFSAGAWAIAGVVALLLMHDAHFGRPRHEHYIVHEIRERTVDSLRIGFGNRAVLLMSLATLAGSAAWTPWWQEWQRYFTEGFGTGIALIGWLFIGFSVAQLIGAELVNRVPWAWRRRAEWMIAGAIVTGIASITVAFVSGPPWIPAVLFMLANVSLGGTGPVLSAWYNEQIGGENRATLLSFQSTFATFGGAAGLPLQGALTDRFGASAAWLTMAACALLEAPCFATWTRGSQPFGGERSAASRMETANP
ncbi:MAG TPA: MFS transporter [Candidatus Binataceae bacterium]|nr:MFS transporter [Candidatus Binataceae bacterium]